MTDLFPIIIKEAVIMKLVPLEDRVVLKALEAENARLKKLLAESMLDNEALRIVARGKY